MKKSIVYIFFIFILTIVILGSYIFPKDKIDIPIDEQETFTETADETDTDNIDADQPAEIKVPNSVHNELECIIIDDFTDGLSQLRWFNVNDGVMGGLSQGEGILEGGSLVHTGLINTNGGGFSSIRTQLPAEYLVGYSRLQIRLNTFGRQYAVNFGDSRYRSVSHQASIPKVNTSSWQEVFIDFDNTIPTNFGFRVNAESFLASAINDLSLILNDGIDGPFRMELDWIKACR